MKGLFVHLAIWLRLTTSVSAHLVKMGLADLTGTVYTPLIGVAMAAVVIVLIINCAGSKKPSSETPVQQIDNVVNEELNMERRNTISMESNPLYTQKADAANAKRSQLFESRTSFHQQSASSPMSDQDEDEMANSAMSRSVQEAKAMTVAKVGDEEPPPGTLSLGNVSSATPTMRFGSDDPTWLHNELRKGDAVNMIKNFPDKCDGLFLVRAKRADAGMYVLDVFNSDGDVESIESYLISRTPTGQFEVDGRLTKTGARSIEGVIAELRGSSNLISTVLTREVPAVNQGMNTQASQRV